MTKVNVSYTLLTVAYSDYATRGEVSLKHSTNKNSELMTVNEVSKYLRISRASVYRLVKERRIPVSRIGKHLRFRKKVIDEWLTHMEKKNHDLQ